MDTLESPPRSWSYWAQVWLKEGPFEVKLFQLVATKDDIEWLITHHLTTHSTREVVIDSGQVSWQVEKFHRSIKQLTGAEKCQCRMTRAQYNHLQYRYLALVRCADMPKQLVRPSRHTSSNGHPTCDNYCKILSFKHLCSPVYKS